MYSPVFMIQIASDSSFSLKTKSSLMKCTEWVFKQSCFTRLKFQWWKMFKSAKKFISSMSFFSSFDFKILLKSFFSKVPKLQSSLQIIVAALGFLLIKANSPKVVPAFNILTSVKTKLSGLFISVDGNMTYTPTEPERIK